MDKDTFQPGIIPSPPDKRDFTIAMACKALGKEPAKIYPKKIRIPYPGKIYNQGDVGACGAYSIVEERTATEYQQRGIVEEFSPGFIYWNRYWSFHKDEGLIMRDALDSLRLDGAVLLKDFPYIDHIRNMTKEQEQVIRELRLKTGKPYHISSYFNLLGTTQEETVNNIKEALMNGMIVIVCIDVYDSFFKTGKDGIVPMPDTKKEKNNGGHAMSIFGADDDIAKVGAYETLNHWGPEWGNNGWCYLRYDFPIREVWALSDQIDANLVKLQQIYEDADLVSPWAREYVVKATKLGLMSGDGIRFNPQQSMTREQMAVVAVKLYEKITEDLKKG